jgi:tRNA dimethylallyltransferase
VAEYIIGTMDDTLPIAVLMGPTGVGKSALALDLAERHGMEIISADSRQVYRHLDIGTAKPTPTERQRVPHHLVDYVDPDEPYSAVRFRDDADAVLGDLARRGVPALIVGGTGHYVQVLVDRIEPPRVPPRPDLRAELEQVAEEEGPSALHARLHAVDPSAARSIPASNIRRVVRALEVSLTTGRPFSDISRRRGEPRRALKLALTMPREALYRRVDARVDAMLAAGWLDEVGSLLARGYDPSLPALSSTGYRELVAHLRGDLTYDEAVQRAKWSTHAYIRRQYVWLRRQSGYHWIEADPEGFAQADRWLAAYVAG